MAGIFRGNNSPMKKRTFLKLTSTALAGSAIFPFVSCKPEKKTEAMKIKNWAGNLTYSTTNVFEPKTVEELQALVKGLPKFRTLGTRHCFNQIADSVDNLVSTKNLNQIISLDSNAKTITVGAGLRYGEFCQYLHERGFAIHNLASLPHISVGGAIATATHGSGIGNGNLATSVSAIEFVTANGEVVTLSREKNPEEFYGAVVGLGSIGVVTKVTLDLVPTFQVRQDVYLNLPLSQLDKNFDAIMSSGYSVSLFHDWGTESVNQIWIKSIVKEGEAMKAEPEFFGAKLADRNVHPIIEISAENCTEQMGVAGPWFDRLPHFKMGFTPSSGEELQAEYFVPRDRAVEAIREVSTLRDEIKLMLMITEIRSIAADKLWMSTAYGKDMIAIHFTLKQNVEGVAALLPKLEAKLAPFNARPHWGKLFSIAPADLQSRYERIVDFKTLMKKYDPDGKLVNGFIEKYV
jgi:alditol oxidase